jgi:Peptidase family S41/N-terminal domain of Peptidase_S41 in eukaryotic IRBP
MKPSSSLLLVALLVGAQAMAQTAPLDKAEKQAAVDTIGNLLTVNYVYPERAEAAKAKIAAALAAGDYDAITDPAAFAQRITADLQSVTHDKHMRLFAPGAGPGPGAAPPPPPPPPSNAGFTRVDRLKGNIGYIKFLGFGGPGPFHAAVDQAMADLASTDALIIDMRDNHGGAADGVTYFCNYFFDPKTPVHVNDLIFRKAGTNEFSTMEFWTKPVARGYLKKPVYLLTSTGTFSGGEEFVNDLKVQKRAKVIGATTGGGANPGGMIPVNPRFSIFVPNGRAENPVTKTNWEGVGVAPDVAVDEKLAFQAAMLDLLGKRQDEAAAAIRRSLATQSDVDPLVEANLLKIRTTPLPGSAEAVRRNLEELASGMPNYGLMSPDLANVTKQQLPMLQPFVSKMGAIKTVTFNSVAMDGFDMYDVTFANGAMQCGIYVTPDGKIASAWIRPANAGNPR